MPTKTIAEPLTVREHDEMEGLWQVVPVGGGDVLRSHPSLPAAWHHALWQPFHDANTLPKITPGNWFVAEHKGYTSDPRFAETVPADSVTADEYSRIDKAFVRFIRATIGDMAPLEAFFPDDMTPDTLAEAESLVNGVPAANEPERHETAAEWEAAILGDSETEAPPAGLLAEYNAADEAQAEALEAAAVAHLDSVDPHGTRSVASIGATMATLEAEAPASDAEGDAESLSGTPEGDPPDAHLEAVRSALNDVEFNAWQNFTDLAETAPTEGARAYWLNMAADIFAGVID